MEKRVWEINDVMLMIALVPVLVLLEAYIYASMIGYKLSDMIDTKIIRR